MVNCTIITSMLPYVWNKLDERYPLNTVHAETWRSEDVKTSKFISNVPNISSGQCNSNAVFQWSHQQSHRSGQPVQSRDSQSMQAMEAQP